MANFKTLGKDLFAYGLMGGISKSVNLLLLPILTNFFSTSEYGTIDIVATLTNLVAMFMTLSLESAVMRFWNDSRKKDKLQDLVSGAIFFVAGIGLITFLLIFLFSETISDILLDDPATWNYIVLGVIASFFMACNSIPLISLRMQRKIYSYNIVNIVQTVLYVGVTLILIYPLNFGLMGVFSGLAISHIVSLIIGVLLTKELFTFNVTWSYLKPSLYYSLPMFPSVFVTWLNNQADRFLLLFFLGLGAVGIFGASAKIVSIITLLVTIFRQAWSPLSIDALDKEESERNEFYSKGLNYYMLIMFSIAIVIVLLSKPLLNLLVPEEYHSGYVIIPWLLGAKILHGAASFTNLGTVISKKTAANSIAAWSGAVLNVGLGFLLIPKYGIAGAAIGSFVAEFVFFSILWFVTVRLTTVKFNIWVVGSTLLIYSGCSLFYLSKW